MTPPKPSNKKSPRDGKPRIHASAVLRACELGIFTEIGERVSLAECKLGDYSYIERHTEAIYTDIGKFCAIAADVRLNALNHPMHRASQHKITYRPNEYFVDAKLDKNFRAERQQKRVEIGHDVWIGHGAIVLPGITIGHGAVIAAGAVVTKNVEPYAIVAGVPAKHIKWRFEKSIRERMIKLAWWDWPHEKLASAIPDMQDLSAEDFLKKHGTKDHAN